MNNNEIKEILTEIETFEIEGFFQSLALEEKKRVNSFLLEDKDLSLLNVDLGDIERFRNFLD